MRTRDRRSRHESKRDPREQLDGRLDEAARVLARGASRRKVLGGIAGAAIVALGLDRAPAAAEESLVVVEAGVPCGYSVCGHGEYCCNESCGICAPVGGFCTAEYCGGPVETVELCGATTCGVGEYCCNPSCGICAPLGGFCTAEYCGEACGVTMCGYGEYCCNASCGICAPLGGSRIQVACA